MIELKSVNMDYGRGQIFENLSFTIEKNKVTTLVGESGCGKTTILNIIAGFINDYTGNVLSDFDIKISYMFQEARLLPWKSVYDNIYFVLKSKYQKNEARKRILDVLDLVKLMDVVDEYPKNLSGGMKQRVALARSIAFPSNVILMDEPFSSLDFYRKVQLIEDFNKMIKMINKTIVLVTHDITSAMMLSDKIVILGGSPTSKAHEISINLDRDNRNIFSKEFREIEDSIYDKMRVLSRKGD